MSLKWPATRFRFPLALLSIQLCEQGLRVNQRQGTGSFSVERNRDSCVP